MIVGLLRFYVCKIVLEMASAFYAYSNYFFI